MNIQKTIRRILREGGFVPLPIRRRISTDDLEEAFAYSLETNATHMDNPNTVLYKEKKPSLWVFSKFVIDDMVTLIEQEYFTNDNRIYFSDTDEDDETYHEKIRQPLLRHYGKRIKEKYDEVMSSNDEEIIQESIRRILREEFDIYNPENYLEDFYAMDFMEEMYNEEDALRLIQKQIDYVQNIEYPLKVYRGIDTISPQEDYGGVHWTTDVRVAEGFGDKIFVGLITNQDSIDIEQTIRTRVMNPYEYEITVPNFDDVKILDIYNI